MCAIWQRKTGLLSGLEFLATRILSASVARPAHGETFLANGFAESAPGTLVIDVMNTALDFTTGILYVMYCGTKSRS